MKNENIYLASTTIDVAENETYLELTNRVCYYDEKNLNNMILPFEGAEDKAKTLIDMPVVGKYRVNTNGEPTFSGHEMFKDENGEISFLTDNIGTHTDVYIQEDTVNVNGNTKTLPCLFAKYRIWKRNKNVVSAVKRLFSEGKLYSSWEIATYAYEFKDGIKKITDYVFLSNCLLGYEYASPSYGIDAKAISLASKENELLVAEALSQDIFDETKQIKEGGNLKDMSKENKENVSDTKNNGNLDTAQLTEWDLRNKIQEQCKLKLNQWCWIPFHFPINKEVWVETDTRESELDYLRFTYTVENDEVTISEPENVKLTVSIAEVNTKIAELESTIEIKNDAIIKAGEEISNLKTEIGELTPFKEKFEIAEQEKIKAEKEEKKENLIAEVVKTKLITKEEIEASEELNGYVENLDAKSLKAVIAERLIASIKEKPEKTTDIATAENKQENEIVTANLDSIEDEIDSKSVMKNYLGGR